MQSAMLYLYSRRLLQNFYAMRYSYKNRTAKYSLRCGKYIQLLLYHACDFGCKVILFLLDAFAFS